MAETFWDRLRGIKKIPDGSGVALRSRAIHTVGLEKPFGAFGLDQTGTVVTVKTLAPNRFFYFRDADLVVELPEESELPPEGATIRVSHV